MLFRVLALGFMLSLPVQAEPVRILSLSSEPPKEWVSEKPGNRLRSHQFKLKSIEAGVRDGEVMVSPEAKPDPGKNFPGWKEQFVVPDGRTAEYICKESKYNVGEATVHLLDACGTWKFKERPFDPKSKLELRDDYRVIWALVILKGEAASIRMSGPKPVVDKYHDGFEKWLRALK